MSADMVEEYSTYRDKFYMLGIDKSPPPVNLEYSLNFVNGTTASLIILISIGLSVLVSARSVLRLKPKKIISMM